MWPTCGAAPVSEVFPEPPPAALSISNACSPTIRFKRAFSFSSLRPLALAPARTPEVAPPAVGFSLLRLIADGVPRCRSGAEP